jgi:hypothetical protein
MCRYIYVDPIYITASFTNMKANWRIVYFMNETCFIKERNVRTVLENSDLWNTKFKSRNPVVNRNLLITFERSFDVYICVIQSTMTYLLLTLRRAMWSNLSSLQPPFFVYNKASIWSEHLKYALYKIQISSWLEPTSICMVLTVMVL